MKKHEFKSWELSNKAFGAYSNEDGITYMQDDDKYYIYYGGGCHKELGTLEDVNAYFETIADEEAE